MSNRFDLGRLPGKSLAEQVYSAIRLSILDESLKGGQTLCIEDLATELGVSATPVREALARLAADSLVTLERNRKPIVATISEEEIVQIYMIRRLLEPYYSQLVAYRVLRNPAAKEEISRLREDVQVCIEALTVSNLEVSTTVYSDYARLDHCFQEITLPGDRGDVLSKIAAVINSYVFRLRMFSRTASKEERKQRILTNCKEHVRIIDALIEGDATGIERSILDHLIQSEERSLVAMMTENVEE